MLNDRWPLGIVAYLGSGFLGDGDLLAGGLMAQRPIGLVALWDGGLVICGLISVAFLGGYLNDQLLVICKCVP